MCVPVCVWGGRAGLVGLCVVLHVKNMWLRNFDLSLLLRAYLYLGGKCVYIFGFIFPCGRKPSCFRMKTCFWASLSFQEIHVKRCNALWSDGNVTVCVCDSWSDVFFTLEAVGIVQHCKVCLQCDYVCARESLSRSCITCIKLAFYHKLKCSIFYF